MLIYLQFLTCVTFDFKINATKDWDAHNPEALNTLS